MRQARTEVGVIGASGQLGRSLTERMHEMALFEVLTNDITNPEGSVPIESMMARCAIVHVVAPLSKLSHLEAPRDGQKVVLHSSAMRESSDFNDRLDGRAAIAHILMNGRPETVVIASDAPHSDEIAQHMTELNYTSQLMTMDEHDRLMADTQGLIAVLVRSKLSLLTGMKMNFTWTDATIDSLVSNPFLEESIKGLLTTLEEMRGGVEQDMPVSHSNQLTQSDAQDKRMAAETQGLAAVLARSKLPTLTAMKERKLLTPSANDLATLLISDDIKWTDSLVHNPFIEESIKRLLTTLEEMRYNTRNE